MNRTFRRVVGIATEAADEPYRTFEVMLLEGDHWSPEMEALAEEIARELGVSGRGTVHRMTDPPRGKASDSRKVTRRGRPRGNGRVGRNDPCPCRSVRADVTRTCYAGCG